MQVVYIVTADRLMSSNVDSVPPVLGYNIHMKDSKGTEDQLCGRFSTGISNDNVDKNIPFCIMDAVDYYSEVLMQLKLFFL